MLCHCGDRRKYTSCLSVAVFSLSPVTLPERQWLLPRDANFAHMFLTFMPSNGPICLSKRVCCVLFPARFVPMPSLQWAPFSPGVRTEASRYLYRANSWGPPSQSSEGSGDGWRNFHVNFRFNRALEMSLRSLSHLLSCLLCHHLSVSPGCGEACKDRLCQVQVSWTNIVYSLNLVLRPIYLNSSVFYLFICFFCTATYVTPRFFIPQWNKFSFSTSN